MALVDDVLLALRNAQPVPADDRVWVLAEVNPDTNKWDWAVHNVTPGDASSAMFSVALSLHDRAVQQEQAAQRAAQATAAANAVATSQQEPAAPAVAPAATPPRP